jgi:hypothetical protein
MIASERQPGASGTRETLKLSPYRLDKPDRTTMAFKNYSEPQYIVSRYS